jgi:uncharacterized membrane protein
MFEFWLALCVFLVSHSAITRSSIKPWCIQRLGKRNYFILYSVLSVFLLAWLIIAAQAAPRIPLWGWSPALNWAPNIIMPFAWTLIVSGFIVPNPLSLFASEKEYDPKQPRFFISITRHPILWGFFLWSSAHIIPNGEFPLVLMFAIFALFSLFGLKIVDKKRKTALGPKRWGDLAQNTHSVLFCSPHFWRGQFRFTLKDLISIILAVFSYFLLYSSHGFLLGASPTPPF